MKKQWAIPVALLLLCSAVSAYAMVDAGALKNIKKQQKSPNAQRPIVDFSQDESVKKLIVELKSSSTLWARVSDQQIKAYVVYYFIGQYKQAGITIKKHPAQYVMLIDDLAAKNPGMLSNPFAAIVQVLAIIEYDFDNGQDKDAMARKVLGEQGYLTNKKRLGTQ